MGECNARSSWGDGVLQSLTSDISEKGVAVFTLTSELRDSKSVHVATTTTHWQVKSWDKVRVRS